MVIRQGDVWWADLGVPVGAEPGFRRPVVVVQCELFNRMRIGTVLCIALTSQLKWAGGLGNVLIRARDSGLDRDSVANVTQLANLSRARLAEQIGRVPDRNLAQILDGVGKLIGR